MVLLEVCVDSIQGVNAAIQGGADRIELCASLELGGITPSYGFMKMSQQMVQNTATKIFVLIRPRGGDFVYSREEVEIMLDDIDKVKHLGLAGVVIGAGLPDGQLDETTLEMLTNKSKGLSTTLHRVFDLVPDVEQAVNTAIKLGFDRILTSGRAKTAIEGIADIQQAIKAANGMISIMPGSGVHSENIAKIFELAPTISEIHSSCSELINKATNSNLLKFGFASMTSKASSVDIVKKNKNICQNL